LALFIDGVYIANTIALDQTLFRHRSSRCPRCRPGRALRPSPNRRCDLDRHHAARANEFSGTADVAVWADYSLLASVPEINVPIGDTIAIRASVQKLWQ